MKTLSIGVAKGCQGMTLVIEDRDYNSKTPDTQFDEDARKMVEVILQLPGGTYDRTVAILLHQEIINYQGRGDDYGQAKADEYKAVYNTFMSRFTAAKGEMQEPYSFG